MDKLTEIKENISKLKGAYFKLLKEENDKRIKDFNNKLSQKIDQIEAKIRELQKQQDEEENKKS